MKPPLIVIALIATTSLRFCEGETKGPEQPTNETPTATSAASVAAKMGGQVVAVGDHFVELKLFLNGHAEAWVLDAKGALIAKPEDAKLTVVANAEGDARPEIALAWEPATARFMGDAEAKGDLSAGPVEVQLDLDKEAKANLDGAVLLVGPEIGGTLMVADRYGVELVADADGNVEALVHDAAGADVDGEANLKLEAKLSAGANGKLTAVALTYDEAKARFVGKIAGDASLAAGPTELVIGGNVAARLPNLALRAEAKHDGRIVVVGDYSVELVAEPGGIVAAYVFDASGKAYAGGDLDLKLKLGAGAFVDLKFDADTGSYRAKFDADLRAQPVTVALRAEGKAYVGARVAANANAKAQAAAKADLGAKANLNANAGAKAKAQVKAPSVKVSAPQVSVKKSGSTGAKAKAGFSFGTK